MNKAAPVAPAMSALPAPGSASAIRYQVKTKYYRRMRVQRVYRMVVELRPADGKTVSATGGEPIVIRPLIPGAHIAPVEQELGPKSSNNKITFSVTPLARGKLNDARLQILHEGRILEELGTPMKGTSQRRTWVLFLLTLLSLGYLLNFFGPLPDKFSTGPHSGPLRTAVVDNVPDYEEYVPDGMKASVGRKAIAGYVQDGYDYLYGIPNLKFYFFGGLFLLTLISWALGRPTRRTRKSKPMLLPMPMNSSANANPLAFGR